MCVSAQQHFQRSFFLAYFLQQNLRVIRMDSAEMSPLNINTLFREKKWPLFGVFLCYV